MVAKQGYLFHSQTGSLHSVRQTSEEKVPIGLEFVSKTPRFRHCERSEAISYEIIGLRALIEIASSQRTLLAMTEMLILR